MEQCLENCTRSVAWIRNLKIESSEKEALEVNSVNPAVLNLRRPGGVAAGNSFNETKIRKTIIHELQTLNQFVIHDELSAPVCDGDHTLHSDKTKQSGT